MQYGYGKRIAALCLALLLLCACMPIAAALETEPYTGDVLMALNTDRRNTFADFTTDREEKAVVEAASEPAQEEDWMLPDAPIDDPEPLSGAQALLRQAQVGDVAPQAAADYRVGDTKRISSHYADSEGKEYRYVDMVCTSVSETATVWRERGTEDEHKEFDEDLAAELDERLPKELEFFGDKRIDTDGDGKIAVFLYEIDVKNIGGYFTVVDLMDKVGRIGSVWHPDFSTSNHMDCIHVQGHSSYSFAVETCLHEYQHYIQASYRFVGRNNFTVLDATEKYINEGFSTAAEYLLFGVDRYSYSFANATKPSRGLSFLNWRHDNGNYCMAFVFSQYLRTRYAALTNDLDSDVPGGTIYKTILESRTPKNDKDTMALVADILYPAAAYPELRDSDARCRQLLYDFWTAVYCQEPEGVHGFNGEGWARNIDVQDLLEPMPAGETEYPIRSGMAAFFRIAGNDTDTVGITQRSKTLLLAVPPQNGFTLRFDAAGGVGAPEARIAVRSCRIPDSPTRSGCTFLGWALTKDAEKPQYYTGGTISLTADTTLYAVWMQSPTVALNTSYPMRRQGSENRNNYCFVPEADGVYKLTYSRSYGATMRFRSPDGAWVRSSYESGTSVYFLLTGGTAYDLQLDWSRTPSSSGSGTFRLTRQQTYYTLTYRVDHPLADTAWSYTGETVYTADGYRQEGEIMPKFMGWSFTENAQTPDVRKGEKLTLTQDTTLYAVCAPEAVLRTDGSEARDTMEYGAFLFALCPEKDGMYAITWQSDGATREGVYESAALFDATGAFLLQVKPDAAVSCALRGGGTYYLYGVTDAPNAVATCNKTADKITSTLTFSVGKKACFDLTLHGKTTYTVPNYTPAALDGRTFLGWEDDRTWEVYAPGDTITIAADKTLTAQWSHEPEENHEIVQAVVNWMPNMFRALRQWLGLRIADLFTR